MMFRILKKHMIKNLNNFIFFNLIIILFLFCNCKGNEYKYFVHKEQNTKVYEGAFYNSKKVGLWKTYHKNGKIKSIGSYKEDKKEGLWLFFYENGKRQQQGLFSSNMREGKWQIYDTNEKLFIEIDYKKGIPNGDFNLFTYKINSFSQERRKIINNEIQPIIIYETYLSIKNDTIISGKAFLDLDYLEMR